MLLPHRTRFKAAFDFLAQDLPAVKSTAPKAWAAFLRNAHLDDSEATDAVVMSGSSPLIFASDLGPVVFGQFDPQLPGRIELGIELLTQFAAAAANPDAQQFLRAKALHELCHWGCFRKGVADNDQAGEDFEREVYGQELLPWWSAAAAPAASPAANPFTDAGARAELLKSLLVQHGQAPGRQDDPARAVFGGADVAPGMPRGYRNNNPGNIRSGSSAWRGLADAADLKDFQRSEQSFCVFREPEWGLRALAFLLRKYRNELGLDTPRKIIARWAPASDNNDPDSYAARVAAALGVTADSVIDPNDERTVVTMMRAIARQENGDVPPYAEVQYRAALRLD